jgi:hypothetical protein
MVHALELWTRHLPQTTWDRETIYAAELLQVSDRSTSEAFRRVWYELWESCGRDHARGGGEKSVDVEELWKKLCPWQKGRRLVQAS